MGSVAHMIQENIPDQFRNRQVILWDGDCGFCRRSVQWVLRQKPGAILAEPYQNHLNWLPPEVARLAPVQVHLLTPDGYFWGADQAACLVLKQIGYRKLAFLIGLPLIRLFSRWCYFFVARNRRLFSRWFFRM